MVTNSMIERYLQDGVMLETISNSLGELKNNCGPEARKHMLYTALDFFIRRLETEDKSGILPEVREICREYGVHPQTGLTDTFVFDISEVDLSPDGKFCVFFSDDRSRLPTSQYDLVIAAAGKQIPLFKIPIEEYRTKWRFSTDSHYLAIADKGKLRVFDLEKMDFFEHKFETESKIHLSWSADCTHLAVSRNEQISVFNTETKEIIQLDVSDIEFDENEAPGVVMDDTGKSLMVFGNGISIIDCNDGKTIRIDDEYNYPAGSLACFTNGEFHIFAYNGRYTVTRDEVKEDYPDKGIDTRRDRLSGLLYEDESFHWHLNRCEYSHEDNRHQLLLKYGENSEISAIFDSESEEFISEYEDYKPAGNLSFDEVFENFNPLLQERKTSENGTFYVIHEDCIFGYTPVVENNRRVRLYRRKYVSPGMCKLYFNETYVDPSLFEEQTLPKDLSTTKWTNTYEPRYYRRDGKTVLANEEYETVIISPKFGAYFNSIRYGERLIFEPVSYKNGCYCTQLQRDSEGNQFFLALTDEVHSITLPAHLKQLSTYPQIPGFFRDEDWLYRYDFVENRFEKIIHLEKIKEHGERYDLKITGSPEGITLTLPKKTGSPRSESLDHELYCVRNGDLHYICDCPRHGMGVVIKDKVFTYEGKIFGIRNISDGTLIGSQDVLSKEEWIAKSIDSEGTLWLVRLKNRQDKDCTMGVACMRYPYAKVDEYCNIELCLQDPWNLESCIAVGKNQVIVLERTDKSNHPIKSTRYQFGKELTGKRSCLPRLADNSVDFVELDDSYLAVYNDSEDKEGRLARQSLMNPETGEPVRMRSSKGGQMHGPKGFYIDTSSMPITLGDHFVSELTDGKEQILVSWNLKNGRRYPDNDHDAIHARLLGLNEDYVFAGKADGAEITERILYNGEMQYLGKSPLDVPLQADPDRGLRYPTTSMKIKDYQFNGRTYNEVHIPVQMDERNMPEGLCKIPVILTDFGSIELYKPGPDHPVSRIKTTEVDYVRVPVLLCNLQYGMFSDETEAVLEFQCSRIKGDGTITPILDIVTSLETTVYAAYRNGTYYILQERAYEGQCDSSEYLWRLAQYRKDSVVYTDRITGERYYSGDKRDEFAAPAQISADGKISCIIQDESLHHHHMVGDKEIFNLQTDNVWVSIYCDEDISVSFDDTGRTVHLKNKEKDTVIPEIPGVRSKERRGNDLVLLHDTYSMEEITVIDVKTLENRKCTLNDYYGSAHKLCGKTLLNLSGTFILEDSE